MAGNTFAFQGSATLNKELGELTGRLQRKHLRHGVADGGRVVIRAVKSEAPRRKLRNRTKEQKARQLWKTVKQKPSSQWNTASKQAAAGIIATAVTVRAPFAAWLEFGHRLIAWGKETNIEIQPQPFFRPAVDSSRAAVNSAIENRIRTGIEKEAAKIRAKVGAAQ